MRIEVPYTIQPHVSNSCDMDTGGSAIILIDHTERKKWEMNDLELTDKTINIPVLMVANKAGLVLQSYMRGERTFRETAYGKQSLGPQKVKLEYNFPPFLQFSPTKVFGNKGIRNEPADDVLNKEVQHQELHGPIVYFKNNLMLCKPMGMTVATGFVALIERGSCGFKQKVYHAQQLGAKVVLVADNSEEDGAWLPEMAIDEDPTPNEGPITIPSLMIKQAVFDSAVDYICHGQEVEYCSSDKMLSHEVTVDMSWAHAPEAIARPPTPIPALPASSDPGGWFR